ncbi:hypothetical protein [Effusibacillus pohliae]|uniref:hypothetical protein n=1 Tax=Effusibacillus pohliae TaxID=232270 RepID=UPI0006842EAA|nr:hypothetical protein [Effusibacillus pohliae]
MGKDRLLEWEWLETLIADVPHVVIGGMAVNQFAPPRHTEDFDVAVAAKDLQIVVEKLKTAGFEVVGELGIGGFSLRSPKGVMIDVVLLDEEWADDAVQHPYRVGPFPVLDLPYLLLLKMKASRGVDIGDMQRMLHGASEEERNRVRKVFERYAPSDLEDLEQLILLSDQAW